MKKHGPHKNLLEWVKENGRLEYAGRRTRDGKWPDSKWRNTFEMDTPNKPRDGDRETVIRKFRENKEKELRPDIGELAGGKAVGCYCLPQENCHVDVLLEWFEEDLPSFPRPLEYGSDEANSGISNYEYITTPHQLTGVVSKLEEATLVGLDLETVGTDPATGILRLVQVSDGVSTLVVDALKVAPKPLLECVAVKELIAHNALFELSWLKHLYDLEPQDVHDTMIMSQVIHAGKIPPHDHGLADVAKRELEIELDKSLQTSD